MADDAAPFPYMRWAKAYLSADEPTSLGLSGLARPGRDVLGDVQDPREGGGSPEVLLREALAAREGVGPDQVHLAAGASHANFLAYLAFARGGRVAVEVPCYEAFLRLGAAVGAEVRPFERRAERAWRIDPDALARAVADGVNLIVVTDLHNPSGTRLHPEDLALLLGAAEAHDALVLIDEVYRDLDPRDRPTAALSSPRVLVTNSLTKSHGMWDLRAGWLLGARDTIARIDEWDDLVCPRLPWLALRETLRFLPHARARLETTRTRCAHATDRVDAWVRSREDVRWVRPDAGFTGLFFLGSPDRPLDGDRVAALAWEHHGVRVVPGSFFQRPECLRASYLLEDAALDQALRGLGAALDEAGAQA